MLQFRLISVPNHCVEILGYNSLVHSPFKGGVKYIFNIAPLMQHVQAFDPSQHYMTWCLTKSPCLFGTREDVIEPTIKPWVSPLSVSKGTGVSGATGPHTLLTTSLVAVTSERGAASLPLTIISLAALPCSCWWRPWTNTAIWIQLGEFSTLRVRVRAGPLSRVRASRKL